MPSSAANPLGPPPFRFELPSGPLRCNAYSLPFKVLATVLVLGCIWWLMGLWQASHLPANGNAMNVSLAGYGMVLAALAMMAYTLWHILTGVTTLSADKLQQTWVWNKELALADLAYVKLIRVRGLDWLIAPRLYARTLLGKFAVFYAADPAMLDEFARLQQELQAVRRPH